MDRRKEQAAKIAQRIISEGPKDIHKAICDNPTLPSRHILKSYLDFDPDGFSASESYSFCEKVAKHNLSGMTLLLGPGYYLYRKLYIPGVVYFIIVAGLQALVPHLFIIDSFVGAVLFTPLYQMKIRKDAERAGLTPQTERDVKAVGDFISCGGTNLGALMLYLGFSFMYYIVFWGLAFSPL